MRKETLEEGGIGKRRLGLQGGKKVKDKVGSQEKEKKS